jgi:hypothetical protein
MMGEKITGPIKTAEELAAALDLPPETAQQWKDRSCTRPASGEGAGEVEELLRLIERAEQHVYALNRGDAKWRMRVPVDEEDSDMTICAALTAARNAAALIASLSAQVAAANERLENNRVYRLNKETKEMERVEVEPGSVPDGIECRDATIRLLDDHIKSLSAQVKREALENLLIIADDNHPKWPGEHGIDKVLADAYATLAKDGEG